LGAQLSRTKINCSDRPVNCASELGQVSAGYGRGVLKIRLAKKADTKLIKVSVGGEKTLEAEVHGQAAWKPAWLPE
jgi:hypothetical protein